MKWMKMDESAVLWALLLVLNELNERLDLTRCQSMVLHL